jgi:PIN domain nuclease of toxin-antitoxin system
VGGRTALKPLVFDTHAWVWWTSRPERLSRSQRAAIERQRRGGGELLVSIISCWELALLCQHGRLLFTIPIEIWLERATSLTGISVTDLSLAIVLSASRLSTPRDSADMLIVATAQHHGARLVTSDTRIAESGLVSVVA